MPGPDLSVQLAPRHPNGLLLRNPVMVAAGTFGRDGYGAGLPPGLDLQGLGAVVAKSTTPRPRAGNPTPRIVHGQGWMLNSIGLQNPGIDAVLRDYPAVWTAWRVPVRSELGCGADPRTSRPWPPWPAKPPASPPWS